MCMLVLSNAELQNACSILWQRFRGLPWSWLENIQGSWLVSTKMLSKICLKGVLCLKLAFWRNSEKRNWTMLTGYCDKSPRACPGPDWKIHKDRGLLQQSFLFEISFLMQFRRGELYNACDKSHGAWLGPDWKTYKCRSLLRQSSSEDSMKLHGNSAEY